VLLSYFEQKGGTLSKGADMGKPQAQGREHVRFDTCVLNEGTGQP